MNIWSQKTESFWQEFIRPHLDVLVATDFFTAEVWTTAGLITYYVLFFIHLASRKVHVASVTPHPDERWMVQSARNVPMEHWGFLSPGQYLIHDRDGKYGPAFQRILDEAGVKRVPLPLRSGGYARSRRSVWRGSSCVGKRPSSMRCTSMWSIIIIITIIRGRGMACSFHPSAKSVPGQARCSVVNGSAGS
jgi:hypothetical protein